MPRRIVITSWGSLGDVFPYVGLARALAGRGHCPVLAVPGFYKQLVEGEGFECRPVGPDVDPNDRETLARVMHPVTGARAIMCDLLMPALRRTYTDLEDAARGADLLVSHPITFAAPVLAQKKQLPWASTVLAPLSFFSPTDLPVLPAAPRWARHMRRFGPSFGRLVVGLARRATRSWMEPVHDLRASLGLPRGADPLFEGQFSPALTLALYSHILGVPQPDWPPNVRTTGFVFYNGPESLPGELEAFLAAGPPPIVFTLGTSAVGAAGRFYQESAAAAMRLGMRAVLLTGGFSQNQPRSMPSDVLLVDRAPHQLLFPRALAVVHQGGMGTTGQALRAGRPTLVVPHAHDQPDNAFRVTSLGVARTLFPGSYRAARVARELQQLLTDPQYERRAGEVASLVQTEKGADAGADALERLIQSWI